MRDLFPVLLLALPFVAFALLSLRRRARYRALASALGARHVDAGPFRPGTIAGEDFELEAAQVGKTYRTRLRLSAGGTPGSFHLRREFFGAAPDWSFVRVPGTRQERVFLWQVELPGCVEPSREQREALLRWLPRAAPCAETQAALAAAGIRELVVADGALSATFRGILSDRARIQRALAALRRLSPGDGSSRAAA